MYGPSPFYTSIAERIAAAGFTALLPDYFFRSAPLAERTHEAALARRAKLDEERSVHDLLRAVEWLRCAGYAATVGTLGFCMGGTLVLDLAALDSDLVTVAYYRFPVPQSTLVSPPPRPLDLVDRLRGPILAFWGDRDAAVGLENVHEFVRRMRETGRDFDHRLYPGVGHGFMADAGDSAAAGAARESWELALAHFRRHLSGATAVADHRSPNSDGGRVPNLPLHLRPSKGG
jgi:carboxymethylenebutenolidase